MERKRVIRSYVNTNGFPPVDNEPIGLVENIRVCTNMFEQIFVRTWQVFLNVKKKGNL